jgi:uncharacterized SAM-dependent methyltransferase
MFVNLPQPKPEDRFTKDTLDWFLGRQHGHMGKWQYLEPKSASDPCRGNELWDIWENVSQKGNMLNRQKQIIKNYVNDMVSLTGPVATLVDLGPGGEHAVQNNTIPFVSAYNEELSYYAAIDMNKDFAIWAAEHVKRERPPIHAQGIHDDFYSDFLNFHSKLPATVLFNGGTIGNFQAEQNTPNSIALMAAQISKLKSNMPKNSYIFIGLEATQDPRLLYGDYDHPAHAAYEINVLHGIKRDLLPHESGFDPYAWKYAMKWWPDAYQFCHIAEATASQNFFMQGVKIDIPKGTQLVVDNSFKFPILAMQRAAQIAEAKYIRPFADEDGRMVVHALLL